MPYPVPVDTGDFKLLDRAVVDAVASLPEKRRYLRSLVPWAGFRQEAVFYDRHARLAGETKYSARRLLGLAFDPTGQLWNIEMAPRGGDELNQVMAGANFGYPYLSNGNHYNGKIIPDHDTDTSGKYNAPKAWWNPVISPSSLMFYTGDKFTAWQGNAFISGLSSMSIIRVTVNAQTGAAAEAQRFVMGKRMRGLKQGPDGNIWAIEDGMGGRLLKLSPRP